MLQQLRSILQVMGRGLSHQHLGEMSTAAGKITRVNSSNHGPLAAGEQSRIVLITDTGPSGPAFDFAINLSTRTSSLLEVLYVKPSDGEQGALHSLLERLGDMTCDFQLTFLTGDLLEKITDYSPQRLDILAVICSATEELAEKLRHAPSSYDLATGTFPSILFVGENLMA